MKLVRFNKIHFQNVWNSGIPGFCPPCLPYCYAADHSTINASQRTFTEI